MVKNDSAIGTRGCKMTTKLVQMTASEQVTREPTEKDLIFAQPHIKKGKEMPRYNFLSKFLNNAQFAHCRPRFCGRQRANTLPNQKHSPKNLLTYSK